MPFRSKKIEHKILSLSLFYSLSLSLSLEGSLVLSLVLSLAPPIAPVLVGNTNNTERKKTFFFSSTERTRGISL